MCVVCRVFDALHILHASSLWQYADVKSNQFAITLMRQDRQYETIVSYHCFRAVLLAHQCDHPCHQRSSLRFQGIQPLLGIRAECPAAIDAMLSPIPAVKDYISTADEELDKNLEKEITELGPGILKGNTLERTGPKRYKLGRAAGHPRMNHRARWFTHRAEVRVWTLVVIISNH